MKKLFGILTVAAALCIPAIAQSGYPYPDRDRDSDYRGQWQGRMSADDQREFNEHYEKWQNARAKNDLDDINKHARKLGDIMARYNIPADTPFDAIATTNGYSRHYDPRDFQGRLSSDDQKRFDKAYEHWVHERREGDHHGAAEEEGKMQEIMGRYRIPRDVPYDMLASSARGY